MTEDTKNPSSVLESETQNENAAETADTQKSETGTADQSLSPEQQIAALEAKFKETHDRLLRTAAELENVRRRSRRDVDEAVNRGRTDILREILPIIDSIELALNSADPGGSAAGIVEGVEMIHRQFLSAAERFGLKPIESVGLSFDPNVHEAVAQVHSEDQPVGAVVEEMRRGYMLGDRLLRASMVIVSKGAVDDAEQKNEDEGQASVDDSVESA